MAIHHESLDLMKHRRMGGVVVMAEHGPRGDDLQRRSTLLHHTDLHWRGMGSKQAILRDKKGILHIPGRMVRGHIERFEIVIVIFDIRPPGDLKPHGQKDIDNLIHHKCQRMDPTALPPASRKSDIDSLRFEDSLLFALFQLPEAKLEPVLHKLPEPVERLAKFRALFGRKLLEAAE